uniref:Uncharacterized protein n=1 Tax=Oryza punctata TaxID=4537 RepID=A0A0E0M787_ORYPU
MKPQLGWMKVVAPSGVTTRHENDGMVFDRVTAIPVTKIQIKSYKGSKYDANLGVTLITLVELLVLTENLEEKNLES